MSEEFESTSFKEEFNWWKEKHKEDSPNNKIEDGKNKDKAV